MSVFVAPRDAVREVIAGRWSGLRDALILVLLGGVTVYTADLAQAILIGWDLGIREGVFELARLSQRRLGSDLLVLLIVAVGLVAPLRITRRLSFDRSLALAGVCWMPLLLIRLAGHGLRFVLGFPPEQPLRSVAEVTASPEWVLGLLWLLLMVTLSGLHLFHRESHD
ncbi:MAG: hypothetical protein ABI333_17315 [bacterium]